jgi:N-acetylglucosamine malate deacetylase 1
VGHPVAMALHAHPDDIEFTMAGTLYLLGEAGYDLHYMNVADGCCGSMEEGRQETAERRLEEAREAADTLGATFHPPIGQDMDIFYNREMLAKLAAVIRDVKPAILLVPSPQDYMEDHINTCRLAVSAAFARSMPNFPTDPPREPYTGDVVVYHALPWGMRDPLRRRVNAGLYVDVSSVMLIKRAALACHRSQKEWLDATQGLDSYLKTMEDMAHAAGRMSGRFDHAEAWRRHLHLGFAGEDDDPLRDALGDKAFVCDNYEAYLDEGA